MKKVFLFIAVMIGLSVTAQSKEQKAVEGVINTYFQALNASDATKIVSLFTSDAELLPPQAPTAVGSEQILGTSQYVFQNLKLDLKVTIGKVTLLKDYAIVTSTSAGTANGAEVTGGYRETFVLRKDKGAWKIARYMYNTPQ